MALGLPISVFQEGITQHPLHALPQTRVIFQSWVGVSQSGRSQHIWLCGFSTLKPHYRGPGTHSANSREYQCEPHLGSGISEVPEVDTVATDGMGNKRPCSPCSSLHTHSLPHTPPQYLELCGAESFPSFFYCTCENGWVELSPVE